MLFKDLRQSQDVGLESIIDLPSGWAVRGSASDHSRPTYHADACKAREHHAGIVHGRPVHRQCHRHAKHVDRQGYLYNADHTDEQANPPPREKGVCHGATSSECAHKLWKAVRSGKADGTHSRKRVEGSRRAKIDTGEERIYHGSEDECPYRNIQSLIDVAPDGVARDRFVSGKGVGATGYCSDCAYTREDE